ncbi:MAG: hypothetical protein QG623_494 [Patescibacteria group bacterium]|nr:hypothetical protein [Patescibacteria group bacterium]
MTSPDIKFIDTDKDQPYTDIPEELGQVTIDLTSPEELIMASGLTYGNNSKTTGAATDGHMVVAETDTQTGEKTGRVALVPIPTIKDEIK